MDEGTTATLASPPLDHIIERPRLISLLEESGARIILLCAPAGYGKTTLARQWSARQQGPVAWYRTTRASGDVAALAMGLDKALSAAVKSLELDSSRVDSIAAVNPRAAPLGRALASTYRHLTREVLLVIDEWESASTEEAEELLAVLADELDLRILTTSRTRPPWFRSRLVVYGEGLEVGTDQLAMTEDEASAVLGAAYDSDEWRTFLDKARGWPAAVGFLALGVPTGLPAQSRVGNDFRHFLAEELFATLPASLADGLIALAVAGVSDYETARLVLRGDAEGTLAEARIRGLIRFGPGAAITLHPLLGDFLESEAVKPHRRNNRSLFASLHTLLDNRRWDEVLAVAEAVPDEEFVSDALRVGLPDLLTHRGVETLRRWVIAGRSAGASEQLMAYVESEIAFREGEMSRALMLAASAAPLLGGDLGARAHLLAASAAYLSDRGPLSDEHIAEGFRQAENHTTRRTAHWLEFARSLEEERHDARDVLRRFEEETRDDLDGLIRVTRGRLHLALLEGGLSEELDRAQAAATLLTSDVDALVRTSFLNIYSCALAAAGHYKSALVAAATEATVADEYGLEFVLRHALVNRARALIGLRQFALAQRTLAQIDRMLRADASPYISAQHAVQTAGLFLSMGDAERAYAAVALDPERIGRSFKGEYLATRALTQTSMDEGAALDSAAAATAASRSVEVHALSAAVNAVVALQRGDAVTARSAIERALGVDAKHALLLALRASLPLAEHLAAEPAFRGMLVPLLIEAKESALARRLGAVAPRSRLRSQQLSPRELEIHGLIAQGMTNGEIARLLFIAESTAKVHVRHILEKLGVRTRTEAARVWQELGDMEEPT